MGRQADRRATKTEGALHELHVGFCLIGAEGEDDKITTLVLKDKQTNMSMATVAPIKSTAKFVRTRRRAFLLEELGLESAEVVAKSDR